MEAMRFGGALQRILGQVLTSDPHLIPVYLRKVDLTDTYTRMWVRMEDVPSVTFLIPKKPPSDTHLVGFHLSLPMGYVDTSPYFCMTTKTAADLNNKETNKWDKAITHPLERADKARAADDAGTLEAQSDAS